MCCWSANEARVSRSWGVLVAATVLAHHVCCGWQMSFWLSWFVSFDWFCTSVTSRAADLPGFVFAVFLFHTCQATIGRKSPGSPENENTRPIFTDVPDGQFGLCVRVCRRSLDCSQKNRHTSLNDGKMNTWKNGNAKPNEKYKK